MKADEGLRSVRAVLNYLDEPPNSDPTRGLEHHVPHEERTNMRLRGQAVDIHDARPQASRFNVESHGFCIAQHPCRLSPIEDVALHNGPQLREIEELLKAVTGAEQAFCIGAQLRFAETSSRAGTGFNSMPARFVHGDFKGNSGEGLFRLWAGMDIRDYSRIAVFNAWRVITPPPQDTPLAVCDARTVSPGDSYPLDAVLEDTPGVVERHAIAAYQYNPAHKWYYFSQMTPDELLIFKTFDSDPTRPYAVPHSAFNDPSFGDKAIPRGSAEARILLAFN